MSWKRNPYKYLYTWIIGLRDQGYTHDQIMKAFKTCPSTIMDSSNAEQVKLADIIIRHALGQASDQEIEPYSHPTEVLSFKPFGECTEGFVFLANTPDGEDDIYFLVEKNALGENSSIEAVFEALSSNESNACNLVLYKAHTQNPYGVSNMPFEVAAAKLTWRDFQ
jgi:hypothetical protein